MARSTEWPARNTAPESIIDAEIDRWENEGGRVLEAEMALETIRLA
jgi:hypothetical protein